MKKTAPLPRATIFFLAALFAFAHTARGEEPEYQLTVSPPIPAIGSEVVITLVSQPGLPPVNSVRWRLGGSRASNSGVKNGDPQRFAFTPQAAGTFVIVAEFTDARGTIVTSTMEIGIGGGVSQSLPPAASQSAPSGQLAIDLNPHQPRLGQPVVLTLNVPGGFAPGMQVRWEISGMPAGGDMIRGRYGETLTLVPTVKGAHYIRALLQDSRGYLLGEVSLGFMPYP